MPIISTILSAPKRVFNSKATPILSGAGVVTGVALGALGPVLFFFAGVNVLPMALLAGGGGALVLTSLATAGGWTIVKIVRHVKGRNGSNGAYIITDPSTQLRMFVMEKCTRENINDHRLPSNGDTLLHQAVRNPDMDNILLLLDSGADPTIPNNFGELPLHLACLEGNLEMVKLLTRDNPETAKTETKDGLTPLHVAAVKLDMIFSKDRVDQKVVDDISNIKAIITHLKSLGADPQALDEKRRIPRDLIPQEYGDMFA